MLCMMISCSQSSTEVSWRTTLPINIYLHSVSVVSLILANHDSRHLVALLRGYVIFQWCCFPPTPHCVSEGVCYILVNTTPTPPLHTLRVYVIFQWCNVIFQWRWLPLPPADGPAGTCHHVWGTAGPRLPGSRLQWTRSARWIPWGLWLVQQMYSNIWRKANSAN